MIPEACVIVEDGRRRGSIRAPVQRVASRVYYNVSVIEVKQDATQSYVSCDTEVRGRCELGTLQDVCEDIAAGRCRVAQVGDVPPKAVLDRIGHSQLSTVLRLEIDGRLVWVGRRMFEYDPMVLNERGHIVTVKRVRDEALERYRAHQD
jgi:hypothetical protein